MAFSILTYSDWSVVLMSVENSPTWYTWPLSVYSKATASTSSLFNALFSEIYPSVELSVYSLLDSSRALSTFSKSRPPSTPHARNGSNAWVTVLMLRASGYSFLIVESRLLLELVGKG